MFEDFLVREDSLKNDYENGKAVGFQFAVRIADYRGCFLSLHNGYYVECDGVEYGREVQTFEVNGALPRDFEEIKKCVWEHWDYGTEGILHVKKEGGLAPGVHKLSLQQSILMQYGYAPHDEAWVKNPPTPGDGSGTGKSRVMMEFKLQLQEV